MSQDYHDVILSVESERNLIADWLESESVLREARLPVQRGLLYWLARRIRNGDYPTGGSGDEDRGLQTAG